MQVVTLDTPDAAHIENKLIEPGFQTLTDDNISQLITDQHQAFDLRD